MTAAWPVALVVLAIATMLVAPGRDTLAMLIPATLLIATLVAALLAWLTRADLRATAAAIDDRCQLANCISSAVQFDADGDRMSTLLTMQARAHLTAISPAQAFPLEPPTHARTLAVAATIAVAVLGAASIRTIPGGRGVFINGSGSSTTDSREETEGARRASAAADSVASVSTGSSKALGARGRTADDATPGDVERLAEEMMNRPQSESGAPADAESTPTVPSRPGGDQVVQSPLSARNAAATGSPSTRASDLAAPASGTGVSRGRRGGSGSGANADGAEALARAGGVRAGEVDSRVPPPTRPRTATDYPARYRVAADAAEEAITRAQVPAELRGAVRAYFKAIRP